MAGLLPAADDVVALVELVQKPRDLGRIVLKVAVQGENQVAPARLKPRGERGRLAEVATEPDGAHARVVSAERDRTLHERSRLPSSTKMNSTGPRTGRRRQRRARRAAWPGSRLRHRTGMTTLIMDCAELDSRGNAALANGTEARKEPPAATSSAATQTNRSDECRHDRDDRAQGRAERRHQHALAHTEPARKQRPPQNRPPWPAPRWRSPRRRPAVELALPS